jgi:hypothetical protein
MRLSKHVEVTRGTDWHVRGHKEGALTINISKISNNREDDDAEKDACAKRSGVGACEDRSQHDGGLRWEPCDLQSGHLIDVKFKEDRQTLKCALRPSGASC